ncbi:hypothetical protein [Agrococcus terreus]|uniref:Uncharacterized protein n=1 Tax=Agrococcus terreus TaxID=574649 RepID=A0ABQ2KN27_9MICO|nr:hypothetical protein [Agrococcus terreus]GGN88238.1 hypothetical protein GCM10010968_23620 [Agrococcus terreus]
MERLALVLAAAAIVVTTGCSAGTEPADSSSVDAGPTATADVAPTTAEAAAAPSEALQRSVIDEVRRTLGSGSGNGPSPDDRAVLVVSVYAERDALDDDRVAAAEREVARLAAAEGFAASFVYGASDGS